MNLKELKAAGVFVSADHVKRSVEWKNPHTGQAYTFDIWVKRQSFGALERLLLASDDRSKSATHIAECVLLGEHAEAMTYEDAYQLEPSLARELLVAVREVNGLNEEAEAKN